MTDSGGVSKSAMLSLAPRDRLRQARRLSSVDLSLMSDNMGIEDNNAGLAGSFQTQMAMALMKDSRMRAAGGLEAADRDRMGRLVLARMKTLEESFADVIKEMRDLKNSSTAPQSQLNSSGDNFKAGIASSEYERRKRGKGDVTPRKGYGKRPVSRRSMKESKVGLSIKREPRDKGKGVATSSSDNDGDDSLANKGSSM
ncbi:hypothetical protein J3458_002106 [Metarhizium acridum]|nr:hypothetical protein J3458_002106 [Metarhizium acridum]